MRNFKSQNIVLICKDVNWTNALKKLLMKQDHSVQIFPNVGTFAEQSLEGTNAFVVYSWKSLSGLKDPLGVLQEMLCTTLPIILVDPFCEGLSRQGKKGIRLNPNKISDWPTVIQEAVSG